ALDWVEVALGFTSQSPDSRRGMLSDESISQINAILEEQCLDIELTFGPFGGFHSPGQLRPVAQQATLSIPSSLRARIEWLSRVCRSYADKAQPLSAMNDSSLLAHFAVLRVPKNLLAHQRYIDRELRTLQRRGGYE